MNTFVNREKEIGRLKESLARKNPQAIVVYGRRRCGKSTLLQRVLPGNAIYFSADLREVSLQISALAVQIERLVPGFSKPVYPDWESLFTSFNASIEPMQTICIDEFPYLVKNSPELPSILQKILDQKDARKFHLVLCGSSQNMMRNTFLNSNAPLYGRCDEIILIKPMKVGELRKFVGLDPVHAVSEYGVWGGVPRYWEIRKQYSRFSDAVRMSILDQNGILYEEPERLFSDEMRTSVQTYSVLSLIGSGVHKPSEIAGRLGKPVTQLSRLFQFLVQQGYIRREIPFGESVRTTKRSLYKLNDPFLKFYFTFLLPNKSRLEFDLIDEVWQEIEMEYDRYVADIWEDLCRNSITGLTIDGLRFNPAARWWGTGTDMKPMEVDLLASCTHEKALMVGEVKWSDKQNLKEWSDSLDRKASLLPFGHNFKVYKALFLKRKPVKTPTGIRVFTPHDLM